MGPTPEWLLEKTHSAAAQAPRVRDFRGERLMMIYQIDSPCSCGNFDMHLTSVRLSNIGVLRIRSCDPVDQTGSDCSGSESEREETFSRVGERLVTPRRAGQAAFPLPSLSLLLPASAQFPHPSSSTPTHPHIYLPIL